MKIYRLGKKLNPATKKDIDMCVEKIRENYRKGEFCMSEFENLFRDVFGPIYNRKTKVYCDKDNYYGVVEVPGFDKDDLDIFVENGRITIDGEKELKLGKVSVHEAFTFDSCKIVTNRLTADVKNGILILTFPICKDGYDSKRKVDVR